MFLITIDNGGAKTAIHEPGASDVKVDEASIIREVNKFDSLNFTIYPGNPGWDALDPFGTKVTVQNLKTGKVAFEGRVLMPVPDMGDDGAVSRTVTCEGPMAYLNDSTQPYLAERNWGDTDGKSGLQLYIEHLLSVHNSKVEEYKRIYPGTITLRTFDTSGGVTKSISRGSTWENIESKLLKVFGGEMRVRRGTDGLLYLDYAESLGTTRSTRIAIAHNMVDGTREIDPGAVVTRLYPYGAKITTTETDEDGTETEVETEERLGIESVNGGVPYIDDAVAIEKYGIIEGYQEWDDVTVAENLLRKGRDWLGQNNAMPVSNTFTALDLALLGLDPDGFEIFDSYPCYNPLLGLDETLEIVKQTIDINSPEESTFDMGDTAYTLSAEIGKTDGIAQEFEEFKDQTQTGITNVGNAVKSTKAAIKVFDDKIQSTVEEKVQQTATTIVKQEVTTQTSDLAASVTTEYYLSTSTTSLSGGSWSEKAPTWAPGKYIWTRTKTTKKDGTDTYSEAACVTGAPGADGDPGKDGTGVTVASTATSYAASDSGTTAPSSGWSSTIPTVKPGGYLWTRVVTTYTDGKASTAYTVARQGADGSDGDPGAPGEDGRTPYFHVAYANSADGSADFSTTEAAGRSYIGTYSDFTQADSTDRTKYAWTLIKGEDGDSVTVISTATEYNAHTSGTAVPSDAWSSSIPTVPEGQYLWTRVITRYSDGSSATSYSVARQGQDGSDGTSVTVSSTATTYAASSSGTTAPSSGWSSSIPAVSSGQYLWTRVVTTYSDKKTSTAYSVARQGEDGSPGSSVTVTSTTTEYNAHTSGTSIPTDAWSTSIPSVPEGQYLWTRVVTKYSDGKTATAYSVARQGQDGANGTSVTVTSTKAEYQTSTSGTNVPTGTWSSTVPAVPDGHYLWTRSTTTYSDGKSIVSYSVSKNGTPGTPGDPGRGVASITAQYYLSTSKTSQTGGSWTETPPTWKSGTYLWTRSKIVYMDPTETTYTSAVCDSSWEAVNEVQVGGRNLITNSNFSKMVEGWTVEGGAELDVTSDETYGTCGKYTATNGYDSSPAQRMYSMPTVIGSGEHMLTFMAKAESGATLYAGRAGTNGASGFSVTTSWKRFEKNFAAGLSGSLTFYGAGTFYITNVKLETGNKATDWTPAPEDVEQTIGDVSSSLQGSVDGLHDSLVGVESGLADTQQKVDEAYEITTENSTRITELLQTAAGFEFNFQELTETITQLGDQTSTEYSERLKYIKFIDGEIWLGRDPDPGQDDFKVVIGNQKISFLQNNIEVAYISNDRLYITNARITTRLEIGNFAFFPRSNGNMTLRYIGD